MRPLVIEGRSIVILFGSETGNSEEIATELGKMAQRLHFQTVVDEMDNFKLVGNAAFRHFDADANIATQTG